ncbi:MAG: peptide-methionine (S)-S-oxide reductase MsrA [Bacillota bacterium]
MKKITLAGGCFWGVEAYFKQLDGVHETVSGYAGESRRAPTYEEVCNGSGHAEAVEITYDPSVIELRTLLKHFFTAIDPTLKNRQGPDIGIQYRSGIYRFDAEDRPVIDAVMEAIKKDYDKPIQTEVKKDMPFFKAEAYHQDYLDKHPNGHCHIDLTLANKIKE